MANNPIPRQEYIRSGTVRSLNVEEELKYQGVPFVPSAATDEKVKVSLNDTTAAYIEDKFVAGSNVTLTVNNEGGNETITIAAAADNDEKAKVSSNDTTSGYLNGKLVAGSNITLTENNNGGNETLTIAAAAAPVTSVNTKTGAVTLTNTDVGAAATSHTHAASDITSGTIATARLGSGTANSTTYLAGDQTYKAAVTSVNGSTGAVTVAATSHTHAASDITSGIIATARLGSGTANNTTFLRGDNTWATPAAGGGGLTGTRYIYVAADGTPTQNGAALVAAYNTAKTMTPTAVSRVRIIAAPGYYTDATGLTMDTDYIDLVSLDGNRSIIFDSLIFSVTANDTSIRGIIANSGFGLGGGQTNLVVQNCKSGDFSFGSFVTVAGTFIDCEAGGYSFGFGSGYSLSGTFIRCTAGTNSFGQGMDVSGALTDCTSGIRSFAYGSGSVLSGTCNRCTAGTESFASAGGSSGITGVLLYCIAPSGGFGSVSGSGKIRLSIGNLYTEVNQG